MGSSGQYTHRNLAEKNMEKIAHIESGLDYNGDVFLVFKGLNEKIDFLSPFFGFIDDIDEPLTQAKKLQIEGFNFDLTKSNKVKLTPKPKKQNFNLEVGDEMLEVEEVQKLLEIKFKIVVGLP